MLFSKNAIFFNNLQTHWVLLSLNCLDVIQARAACPKLGSDLLYAKDA